MVSRFRAGPRLAPARMGLRSTAWFVLSAPEAKPPAPNCARAVAAAPEGASRAGVDFGGRAR
ncbi:MAG: hypothetical protein HYZ53_13435 [Planctomycetes bacterium]|nr:hypothetical protein [Planctomycetota bacterium]